MWTTSQYPKGGKNPNVHQMNEWINKMLYYPDNGILFSHKNTDTWYHTTLKILC